MYRASWSCTSTSVITRNKNYLCARLGNTWCNCTNTSFWNKLDWYSCILVSILKVVYKLCQILDWIYIMMWWWWNKRNTRSWKTSLCNPRIHLLSWKMSTFTRLSALCHLNLNLLCAYKVSRSNAESSWCNLLDCRASVKTIRTNL